MIEALVLAPKEHRVSSEPASAVRRAALQPPRSLRRSAPWRQHHAPGKLASRRSSQSDKPVWSRPAARPSALSQIPHLSPITPGFGPLVFGSAVRIAGGPLGLIASPLWCAPFAAGWALTGLCALGLLFTGRARLCLGSLWSGLVSRKDAHPIVRTGAYGLVRRLIYTELILAAFALAIQVGMAANRLGAGLIAFGFWLKASLEERFLGDEFGADYAAYRRRTPMLIRSWRV